MSDDNRWMPRALELARHAEAEGEVPVGAVVALREACLSQQNYRLPGADLYVTLEPCVMCAGALVHARINRVIYATPEPKTGAAGSCIDVFSLPNLNHRVQCESGVMAEQSSQLLRTFFRARR